MKDERAHLEIRANEGLSIEKQPARESQRYWGAQDGPCEAMPRRHLGSYANMLFELIGQVWFLHKVNVAKDIREFAPSR